MPKSQKQIDEEILRAKALSIQIIDEFEKLAARGWPLAVLGCAAINALKTLLAKDGVTAEAFAEWLEDIALDCRRQAGLPPRQY
jgi:hypothetical protein